MNSQGPWPGRFVWHDLMTTDAAKATAFYTALFDWRVDEQDMQGHGYRMIHCGPGPIGGIMQENIPASSWLAYVAVDDVDAAAAKCKRLGGATVVPPTDIPNTGRFAVLRDPQGAHFAVFAGKDGTHGFDPELPVPGRICWNELLTTDDAAAQHFYSAMFGWRDQPKDMGPMGTYHVQLRGDTQAGGLMKNPMNGAPNHWLVYFLVADLRRATDRAKQLGAAPMVENMPIPGIGAFSMLGDPTGAVFGLFWPDPNAPR